MGDPGNRSGLQIDQPFNIRRIRVGKFRAQAKSRIIHQYINRLSLQLI